MSPCCLASAIVSTFSCQKSQCIAFQMINFSSKTRSWQSLLTWRQAQDVAVVESKLNLWTFVVVADGAAKLQVGRHSFCSSSTKQHPQSFFRLFENKVSLVMIKKLDRHASSPSLPSPSLSSHALFSCISATLDGRLHWKTSSNFHHCWPEWIRSLYCTSLDLAWTNRSDSFL